MSLLSIVANAAVECNIKKTTADVPQAIGSQDANIQRLVTLAKRAGIDAMRLADWRNLKMEGRVYGDSLGTTLFALPQDFQRMRLSNAPAESLLVSLSRPIIPIYGPVDDAWLNNAKAYPGRIVYPVWRLLGGSIEVWPALVDGETVVFNYMSKNWIMNAAGTLRKADWTDDTDIPLISENIIELGAIWRYKRSKGLDYAEEFRDFELAIAAESGQDGSGRVVSMSGGSTRSFNDSLWPGFITPAS